MQCRAESLTKIQDTEVTFGPEQARSKDPKVPPVVRELWKQGTSVIIFIDWALCTVAGMKTEFWKYLFNIERVSKKFHWNELHERI